MRTSLRIGAAAVAATVATAGAIAPATAAESQGPKNIIYMIGDGMGYGHVAFNNLYETGQSKYLVDGAFSAEGPEELDGESVQRFEDFNRLSMTTYPNNSSYDPQKAWASHEYVDKGYTDSSAAGTAMSTGVKTDNGKLGVNDYGHEQENTSERAKKAGKSAGVVSSVPFSHATPAAWAAHNISRNNYLEIADEMFNSDLDVIMGAGHPFYDDDNKKKDEAKYKYLSEEVYNKLSSGESDWNYAETKEQFEALAQGEVAAGEKYFGLAPVASTLQQGRTGESAEPFDIPFNDVVDLPTMTTGALNALGQNDEGFHVMIEGGAIDWSGHGNESARDIEEVQDFNKSVDAAIDWVEENSSWDETLLVVTADHETGYLSGANERSEGKFNSMNGGGGNTLPSGHQWYSTQHTNQVVPFFFKGAGSEALRAKATHTDPVRGDYIDNTTLAKLTLNEWWIKHDDQGGNDQADDSASDQPGNNDNGDDGSSKSGLLAGIAGAGIASLAIGAIAFLAQKLGIITINPNAWRNFFH